MTTEQEKRTKFEELATARTKKAIQRIRQVAGMGRGSNRYNYSFAEIDVERIVAALLNEIEELRRTMTAPGRQMDIEFDLREARGASERPNGTQLPPDTPAGTSGHAGGHSD